MLRSLLNRSRAVARGVHVYISVGNIIVAATHRNLAGIYYEQPEPLVISGAPSAEQLGNAFREAFERFSIKDANLRDAKRSDWASYQASGLRSIKEFERLYRRIICYGVNQSNAIVRASIAHPARAGIELSTSFNPQSSPEAVGECLMQLMEAANAT